MQKKKPNTLEWAHMGSTLNIQQSQHTQGKENTKMKRETVHFSSDKKVNLIFTAFVRYI